MGNPDKKATKIFIYGSCVSRDTVELLIDEAEIVEYIARQSIISAFNPLAYEEFEAQLKPIPSNFQQRMVRGDIEGSLPRALKQLPSDVDLLLFDLVDERGGVVQFKDGYVTKLAEFWGHGGREMSRGREIVEFGSEQHFSLWSAAASTLIDILTEQSLLEKVLILRIDWAETYKDGTPYKAPDWMLQPSAANSLYPRYFDFLEDKGCRIITVPLHLAVTDASHQWGPSPFHYSSEAYEYVVRYIKNII